MQARFEDGTNLDVTDFTLQERQQQLLDVAAKTGERHWEGHHHADGGRIWVKSMLTGPAANRDRFVQLRDSAGQIAQLNA